MPPTMCQPHFMQVVAWLGTCGVAFSAVLGVAPDQEARYSGTTFSCLSGDGPALSSQVVNDGFCDCTDGSDEPGTGACAGQENTLFYCKNEGSTPRRIYASRVGDGICDCCDGSDEAELAARHPNLGREMQQTRTWMGTSSTPFTCSDTCAEQGRLEQKERVRRIEELKQGIAKQEQGREKAILQRQEREVEIKQLESELPALEEALKQVTQLANVEREAEKAAKEAEEVAKAKNGTDMCKQVSPECMWRQTGGCTPDGSNREADKDKVCSETLPLGASGFCDCNGDGIKGDTEMGYDCDSPARNCCSVCGGELQAASGEAAELTSASDGETPSASDGEEKPQVSEYSKWMDGAEEKLADNSEEKPQVSEYSKWMDGAEEKLAEDQNGDKVAGAENAEIPKEETAASHAADEQKTKTAIELEAEAKSKVDDLKTKISSLKAKNIAIPHDYLGYAGLDGVEISKRDGEFEYKIHFFQDAKQDYTSLGSWGGFDGPYQASFKHGTRCWDGPERELKIVFKCGVNEQVLDVIEPSKCVYQATVIAAGACTAEELERQSSDRVIGPKEEL